MNNIIQLLLAELQELYKARDVLHYSYTKCVQIQS